MAIDGQDKSLGEWSRGKLTHVNTQLGGLRESATAGEKFVHKKFSPQESGASAPESSSSQGYDGTAASHRLVHATSSTAASSSAARVPTPTHAHEPAKRATPAAPSSTTIFSTIQSDVQAGAIRIEISDPDQWSSGDVAILQNQEAERVERLEVWSLIHHYNMTMKLVLKSDPFFQLKWCKKLVEDWRCQMWIPTDKDTSNSGSMTFPVALWRSKLLTTQPKNVMQLGIPSSFLHRSLCFLSSAKGMQNLGSTRVRV